MILCCGESLIDMIPTATTAGADGFVPHAGGAVFNTAIALGRLGAQVDLLSGVSTDVFGQQLVTELNASNVHTNTLVISDRPTTLAFVSLIDGQASYSFFDENSAGRMIAVADMPFLSSEIEALFFGGISLACEPCADAYAAFLKREGTDRAVMLDPNIRPDFIADADRYRARLDAMMALSDIVKVSDEDLDWIDPSSRTQDQKVAALLEKGPSMILVTAGRDGARCFRANGSTLDVPSMKTDVVDTVGAGDTFNAGFLAHLQTRDALTKNGIGNVDDALLQSALTQAAKVAAITVSRRGANPPWEHEIG